MRRSLFLQLSRILKLLTIIGCPEFNEWSKILLFSGQESKELVRKERPLCWEMRTLSCFTVVRTSVVYQYSCGQCSSSYIGQTVKQLKVRISQHKGRSFRINSLLSCPENSKILDHSLNSGHPIIVNNFKILDSCKNNDLRILESLWIHKLKPSLNDRSSSAELSIITWFRI